MPLVSYKQTNRQARSAKAGLTFTPARNGFLQRKCACGGNADAGGECEECRRTKLQRKTSGGRGDGKNNLIAPPIIHEVLRSPGQPLDRETVAMMQPRFGHDFSRVRIHADARAAEAANAVGASAFTVGRDVVFGADEHRPRTQAGSRLLAHELAHVVQQATASWPAGSELRISNDLALEQEADAAGAQVSGGESVSFHTGTSAMSLQRQTDGPNKPQPNDDCSG